MKNDLSRFNSINVNRRNIGIKQLRLTPIVDIWKLTNKNIKKLEDALLEESNTFIFFFYLARRVLVVGGDVSKDPFMFIVWSSYSH